MSDDRVSVKSVLLICPTFRYITLCERIEHSTARIDHNQDLLNIYIYIYIYIKIKPLKSEAFHETGLSGYVVASFFPLIIFILLCFNVLSTVPRENRLADFLYI